MNVMAHKLRIGMSGFHDKLITKKSIPLERAKSLLKSHENTQHSSDHKYWYWFDINGGESFFSNENIKI